MVRFPRRVSRLASATSDWTGFHSLLCGQFLRGDQSAPPASPHYACVHTTSRAPPIKRLEERPAPPSKMSGGSILPRLKRIPSFTTSRRREPPLSLGLRHVDPMLRFSLSRLVEGAKGEVPRQDTPSPAAEARFAAGWDQKFREEWERLRRAVFDLFNWPNQPAHAQLSAGQLTALHNDVHVLLRSQAGTFIFEYYQNTLLPDASEILFEHALSSSPRHFPDTLAAIWTHFYCHTLPALEAIFVSVKNHKLSIRQASLVAFRDCVIMKLESKLTPELEDQYLKKKVSPAVRQMFLVLQVPAV
uniref:Uncharacterized protein n=1 Tax=Timema cristinae TaxID=61476 RepID=A0A7R9GZ67_TIMCR|nr:unnamed protein product [Timema cristinae]